MAECRVDGCDSDAEIKGLCTRHYQREYRKQNAERRRLYDEKRRERRNELNRRRYAENRDEINAKQREKRQSKRPVSKLSGLLATWGKT